MIQSQVRDDQWLQLSELIAGKMGLHFPLEQREGLQRGIAGATKEFGYENVLDCVRSLLSGPLTKSQLQILASHLTVGETYFFRDKQTLDALAKNILPELIRARRGREQTIRIWSAACCSGEEAYSLAILLHQALPDLSDWQITITASDINPRVLQKARKSIYSEWSFRNAPSWLKQSYFERTPAGLYTVIPEIRKMVNFVHLNLVEDCYPSLMTATNAMDVIFCRNVLMYFTSAQIGNVIAKLRYSLVDGGWLAVSPSEGSKALFPNFIHVNFPGAIFFQKNKKDYRPQSDLLPFTGMAARHQEAYLESIDNSATGINIDKQNALPGQVLSGETHLVSSSIAEVIGKLQSSGESLYLQGLYSEVTDTLLAGFAKHPIERHLTSPVFSLMARALANQGMLNDALEWCDRWIAADKLNVAAHYLRGVILLEQGKTELASSCFQRALYLQPDFALAHFSLGSLAHNSNKLDEASRHFANALQILGSLAAEEVLPESEGLTAGRLIEFIYSMQALEHAK